MGSTPGNLLHQTPLCTDPVFHPALINAPELPIEIQELSTKTMLGWSSRAAWSKKATVRAWRWKLPPRGNPSARGWVPLPEDKLTWYLGQLLPLPEHWKVSVWIRIRIEILLEIHVLLPQVPGHTIFTFAAPGMSGQSSVNMRHTLPSSQ